VLTTPCSLFASLAPANSLVRVVTPNPRACSFLALVGLWLGPRQHRSDVEKGTGDNRAFLLGLKPSQVDLPAGRANQFPNPLVVGRNRRRAGRRFWRMSDRNEPQPGSLLRRESFSRVREGVGVGQGLRPCPASRAGFRTELKTDIRSGPRATSLGRFVCLLVFQFGQVSSAIVRFVQLNKFCGRDPFSSCRKQARRNVLCTKSGIKKPQTLSFMRQESIRSFPERNTWFH